MKFDRRLILAGWLASVALLVWLYHDGLWTWFLADDFAWLSLPGRIHSFGDFVREMFTPQAQGTIRPLADRGFFLLFESIFGLESFPMRVCAFAVMAANLALVGWLARRMTGSVVAGVLAPVLWISNSALVTVMYWNSAFNEALCALFLLASLFLFARFAETGKRKWWWWQLAVFVFGFGALETNVVYPALAAAWVLFVESGDRKRRRELLGSLVPLVLISIVYFLVHRAFAPLPAEGIYQTRLDGRVLGTFWQYLYWTAVPQIARRRGYSGRLIRLDLLLTGLGLAIFTVAAIRKRRRRALFSAAWFLIPLAPMLLLPEHLSDYYLTIPLIGVAILAAWGVAEAATTRGPAGWAAWGITAAALGIYLFPMIPSTLSAMRFWRARGDAARGLVLGVAEAHQTHPDKFVVLDGVPPQVYTDAVENDFYYAIGMRYIDLTPETRGRIRPSDPEEFEKDVLAPAVMRRALDSNQVVVYSLIGDHLRNITEAYRRSAPNRLPDIDPHRVEAGNPLYSWLLGPEWFPAEGNFRWMPRRATVRLAGPDSVKDRLILEGSCAEEQLKAGPVHLMVSVDGTALPVTEIDDPELHFRRLYDLPAALVGQSTVTVTIEVDKVLHSGDRDLGLTFGTIAIE